MPVAIVEPGEIAHVPRNIATCPECDGTLSYRIYKWEASSLVPAGILLDCQHEPWDAGGMSNHCYRQCQWQDTINNALAWAKRTLQVGHKLAGGRHQ